MATPNALFAIMHVSNPASLSLKLREISPWISYELGENEWLIIAPTATTSKEVADRLDLSGAGSTDTGMVVRVENYFGREYPIVWEWISTKLGAELGPLTTA